MKKILDIALLKVRLTLKDRSARTMMFIAPIIFIFILVAGFGSGGSSSDVKYPVTLVDKDKGYYSEELVKMLKEDKAFVITETDYDKAKKAVEDSKTAMAIVIPEGYSAAVEKGQGMPLEIIKLQANETTIALTSIIGNYMNQIRIGEKTGEAAVETLASANIAKNSDEKEIRQKVETSFMDKMSKPVIAFSSEKAVKDGNQGLSGLSTTAIGILVMFIMFFVTGGAGSMLEERELGTWNRILSTPTKNYNTLGGFLLGNFFLGWIQVGALIIVSRYVFNISWGNSLLGLIVLFSCFLLAVIGFGTALASFVKSKAQLSALSTMIVVPTCMIAGCLWPKDIMPQLMINIANFIPQTWVLTGMTDLVTRNSEINAILFPSAILLIFAAVFFTTGLTFMGLKEKN
ncbi:MAG: ABC transporter permease [Bacillota bacterium]|nr:ABC transporter permease [Bacillota bacterium]